MREFGEVTGIRFSDADKPSAVVSFTVTRRHITTPFGRFKGLTEGQRESYDIDMALYDDGWRVASDLVPDNLPASEYAYLTGGGMEIGIDDEAPQTISITQQPTTDADEGIDNMNDLYLRPADPEAEVLNIRREYQRINAIRLRKETFDWEADGCEGGQLRYDFEGDRLVRIVESGFIGHHS
ncbi:MAG: hypothetical protein OHK0039_34850 [Bacteroidia bacterium]